MKVKRLKQPEDWEELKKKAAKGKEIIIYKFSPFCPVSIYTETIFDKWADEVPDLESLNLAKLNVVASKSLSRQISAELRIVHESPQVIWLSRNLEVKWDASHYEIDKNELDNHLAAFQEENINKF